MFTSSFILKAHLPDPAMINKNPGRIKSDVTQPYDFLVCTGKSYSGGIPSEEQIAKVLESNNEISKAFKIFMDLLETQGELILCNSFYLVIISP